MMLCQREEREAGRAYPRTCPTCKLGPCQKFGAKPLQSLADAQAEIARLTAERDAALAQVVLTNDGVQAQLAEGIGAILRKFCDSDHASRARHHLHEMPKRDWNTLITMLADAVVSVPADALAAQAARDARVREKAYEAAALICDIRDHSDEEETEFDRGYDQACEENADAIRNLIPDAAAQDKEPGHG